MSGIAHAPRLPPTFNRLAWSNLAAQSAEQVALAAAPIVAVLLLGVGEGRTGLLQMALTLPFILFAIPAGLLADRCSRRWLMAGSEGLRALALIAILLLIRCNGLTLPLLALSGFVAVCGTVVYSVAAPALVPSLVAPDLLPAANARIELARTIAFAGGPALGGVLVGGVGAAPAFGFAAALSVVAVMLLSGIHEPARAPVPRRHPLQDIREGAEFVVHHPLLRPVFVTQFIFNTGSFLVLAVFVPYAVRRLGLSATGVGTTLSMYGVGMVVGALAATRVMRRLAFGTVIALGPVTGLVAAAVWVCTFLNGNEQRQSSFRGACNARSTEQPSPADAGQSPSRNDKRWITSHGIAFMPSIHYAQGVGLIFTSANSSGAMILCLPSCTCSSRWLMPALTSGVCQGWIGGACSGLSNV